MVACHPRFREWRCCSAFLDSGVLEFNRCVGGVWAVPKGYWVGSFGIVVRGYAVVVHESELL